MTKLCWGAATDAGRVRRRNEDSILADQPVFLVADGMGGHAAGEVASHLAMATFLPLTGRRDVQTSEIGQLIAAANEAILQAAAREPRSRGMGSTVVGLVLVADRDHDYWVVFNIGDSRLYRFAQRSLEQITVDHSYVQELVEAGRIKPQEARGHPERNVVTRALGSVRMPEADYWLFTPELGERYLLCSDGLSTEVEDRVIADLLHEFADPVVAAEALVREAVRAGGRDNVSAVVVDVVDGSYAAGDERLDDTAPRPELDTQRLGGPRRRGRHA